MIKAVIFDVDGVLIDSFEANLKFISDLLTHFGYRAPSREEFPDLFHRPMKHIIQALSGLTDEEKINRIWSAGKDLEVPYPFDLVSAPADLKQVLDRLKEGYTLGVVTSRTKASVYRIPVLSEIEKHFSTTIGYQDTEKHKPEPDPLLLAAEKLNFRPEECVYIGDSENDMIAAKAAGMKGIIYGGTITEHADANTTSFSQLPDLIEKL